MSLLSWNCILFLARSLRCYVYLLFIVILAALLASLLAFLFYTALLAVVPISSGQPISNPTSRRGPDLTTATLFVQCLAPLFVLILPYTPTIKSKKHPWPVNHDHSLGVQQKQKPGGLLTTYSFLFLLHLHYFFCRQQDPVAFTYCV